MVPIRTPPSSNLVKLCVDLGPPELDGYETSDAVLCNARCATDDARWADAANPPLTALSTRRMWRGDQLVPMFEAGVSLDRWCKPLNPFVPLTRKWGRGELGKWGPNHAADPIVTTDTSTPGLKSLLLIRRLSGKLALPGGMVDAGESYTTTLAREIEEEAVHSSKTLRHALGHGTIVFTGFVDDPRTTNNAWIETVAVHAHLTPFEASAIKLRAAVHGETLESGWFDATDSLLDGLHADHGRIVRLALNAMHPRAV